MAYRISRFILKLILILLAVYISVALLYYAFYVKEQMGLVEILKEPIRIIFS